MGALRFFSGNVFWQSAGPAFLLLVQVKDAPSFSLTPP